MVLPTVPFRLMLAVLPVLLVLGLAAPAWAAGSDAGANTWIGSLFGAPKASKLAVTDPELQSLGCVAGAALIATGAIIVSGAAIAATGGRNAATAAKIAVPVLAAAMMAGCTVGSGSALGLAWLARNSKTLAGDIVDVVPVEPLKKVLPMP